MITSAKRHIEYQAQRSAAERTIIISTMPVLIGAAVVAAAILLATLINAIGTRYVGLEGPSEESVWLIDRLTGHVYRCEASQRGKANCDADIATGSIPERPRP